MFDVYRGYTLADGKAVQPLNVAVCGDITIIVYHARSTFGGKVQGKVSVNSCFDSVGQPV